MCTVSFIGDHFSEKWKQPNYDDILKRMQDVPNVVKPVENPVTRLEFETLKKEVEEMKQLLLRAKKYDEENNEPNCEMAEKVAMLKKVADLFGVSLDDVFKP